MMDESTTDQDAMELRSEMWDKMAEPKVLAVLHRIEQDGRINKADIHFALCAVSMVIGEVGVRAEVQLDAGGVLP